MSFSLNMYPLVYRARFGGNAWTEEWLKKDALTASEEAGLSPSERQNLLEARNTYPDMPIVSYTSQYGLGCFEGLKAFPQKNGGMALFRSDQNAARFRRSMEGLYMPGFPEDLFLSACMDIVGRNAEQGYKLNYSPDWEKDSFASAEAIYLRPFSYSEGAIGVSISKEPWVIVIASPVGAYFSAEKTGAITTDRVRATPNGTGWIKAASNYVVSALAKHEACEAGFMECIFLDACEKKYIEEGSSCNIFVRLKSGELVTPELGDTILPGITRASLIELARDMGVEVSERKLSIEEALDNGVECFASGTAAGLTPISSLTHKGKTSTFNGGKMGELSAELLKTLKGIQYGLLPDTKGWMQKLI